MTTKSREYLFGSTVKVKAEQAATARKNADRLACEAWNARMLDFRGPASPAIGDALNAGYGYLEVCCLGCKTHQTVALDIIRRPKTTPVHELERYMRCKTDEGEQSGDVEKKASGTGFVKGRPLRYLGQLKRENLFHSWSSFFRLTAK